jgi:integrase/recombinase XerD
LSEIAVAEPGWAAIERLVLDGLTSTHSKRAYSKALRAFGLWFRAQSDPFAKATVQRYRNDLEARGLAASTINVHLAAVRKLAVEASDNGLLGQELAAGIARVRGARRHGVRAGNWLSKEQAKDLLEAPNASTVKGKRDRALLALLIGAGLRRQETAALTVGHIQLRDGRWVIVDLEGKGNRVRTVPIPEWAKRALDQWLMAAGVRQGVLFRPITKGGVVSSGGMSAQAVFLTVKQYAEPLGLQVAPHDLRRTFAKLAYRGKAPLEQIQFSLGHASILTTERYLGVKQDLRDAPCDHLDLLP